MRVRVDLQLCEANAVCTGIAPDIFELDDDDNLHLLVERPGADRRAAVEEAVLRCPKQAISVES